MFNTIKNALKTPDVRKRVLYTLLLIVIFRLGCFISVPTVDYRYLPDGQGGITQLIDTISGGAFSNISIFALSITPYITASIVIQLLAMIVPSLERLTKEGGEDGRNKINKYTKIVTLVLAFIEGLGYYLSFKSQNQLLFIGSYSQSGFERFMTAAVVILSFMAGTSFLMWLGDQITNKGIGNGISMLIFVGIVSGLPDAVIMLKNLVFTGDFSTTNLITALAIIIGTIILVSGVVFVQQAERKVPVQYSKRVVGRKMMGAQNTHIPLKLAMAGVMPIIFASSFMTFPAMIIQIFKANIAAETGFLAFIYKLSIATSTTTLTNAQGIKIGDLPIGYSIANAIIYLLLIVGFTFFYTYATFNPAEVSNNIKKNGGFIPGIRAGKPTTQYLSSIISKLTLFGGLFLAIIAIIPMLIRFTDLSFVAFGGTSILIVVGVALETVQQLESQLVMRHYKGFLE